MPCMTSRLKSNMDRFIDYESLSLELAGLGLKSNMDRFIAIAGGEYSPLCSGLKSNMDRFIVLKTIEC